VKSFSFKAFWFDRTPSHQIVKLLKVLNLITIQHYWVQVSDLRI
jgi:hypothetical protein